MYTGFSLSAGIIYLTALYMLMPLYSALEKIPASCAEAAADLGSGAWTRFRRVTLPLSLEGIAGFFHVAGDQWPVGAVFSCIMLVTAPVVSGGFNRLMGHLAGRVQK